MAKGPIVTPEIEILIRTVHKDHPRWKAPRVRNEVESILRQREPNSPKGWPSLSKVQKVLATVRRKEEEGSEEDELWHIGTIRRFPIPAEALRDVITFWIIRCGKGERFTIREAQWLARLYNPDWRWSYDEIDECITTYARSEEALEKLGFPPGFMPFNQNLDLWVAETVIGFKANEKVKNNMEKLYKKSDMELKADEALWDLEVEAAFKYFESRNKEAQNERVNKAKK